jgi:hypothetical protein
VLVREYTRAVLAAKTRALSLATISRLGADNTCRGSVMTSEGALRLPKKLFEAVVGEVLIA